MTSLSLLAGWTVAATSFGVKLHFLQCTSITSNMVIRFKFLFDWTNFIWTDGLLSPDQHAIAHLRNPIFECRFADGPIAARFLCLFGSVHYRNGYP